MENIKKFIINTIKINGFIALDEFIAIAMCHPKFGYYSKSNPIKKDFITSPEISNSFGIIIAGFFLDKLLQVPNIENLDEIHFIEFGGGSGKLAFDILDFLEKTKKINNQKINNILEKIVFNSIEFSDNFHKLQKNKLNNILFKKNYWKNIDEFLKNIKKEKNNYFIFYSNEFLDALPVKQFIFNENKFEEIIICEKNDNLYFSKTPIKEFNFEINNLPDNGILEIPFAGIKIINDIMNILNNYSGIFLTCDYGFQHNSYKSTIQGIYNGNKTTDMLQNIGETDITHLINFELFQNIFKKNNFQTFVKSQRDFLIESGILSLINEHNKSGIERLLSENQMGNLFNFLVAEKL